jgi:hypothetical protein
MKCISIAQPWASALLAGLQDVEYRCYATDHRGDILIHASLEVSSWARKQMVSFRRHIPDWKDLPFGRVIGVVELWACEAESDGVWKWCLRRPRSVKPFRFRAGKRVFDVNDASVEILSRPSRKADWRYSAPA